MPVVGHVREGVDAARVVVVVVVRGGLCRQFVVGIRQSEHHPVAVYEPEDSLGVDEEVVVVVREPRRGREEFLNARGTRCGGWRTITLRAQSVVLFEFL